MKRTQLTHWICILFLIQSFSSNARRVGYKEYKFFDPEIDPTQEIVRNYKIKPSIKSWDSVDTPKRFSITSMVVDHHSDGSWYLDSLHEKHSIGWNRTTRNQFLTRPFACNIRFVGVGLEATTLKGFETGGTGYMTIGFENGKKKFWHGFDKNETNRLHCYYTTNKDTGSEFLVRSLRMVCYSTVTYSFNTRIHLRILVWQSTVP